MIEWLIDSTLSAAPYIVVLVLGSVVAAKFKLLSWVKSFRLIFCGILILICAFGLSSLNRPKFDRVPDQTVQQKAYESEIEYKASKDVNKTISIQEQHKDLVEETKKKFEY